MFYEDHPRGCGEHRFRPQLGWPCGGSSPRMRGTRGCRLSGESAGRIIPADAGNTLKRLGLHSADGDHPRGCGEHVSRHPVTHSGPGSSPRMRGTLTVPLRDRSLPRIIPADAGNTDSQPGRRGMQKDHPRGCGEHTALALRLVSP